MKNLLLLVFLLIAANSYAEIDCGITVGGGVGFGMPYDAVSGNYYDDNYNTFESGITEVGWTIRPALILGSNKKFAIGIEYTYKYQNYTVEEHKTREITEDYPFTWFDGTVEHNYYTRTEYYSENVSHTAISHNIGLSFTEKLSTNPNWWTIGYDTDGKGPFFNANIGVFHGPDDSYANFMIAVNTYISTKKIALGITLNFQAYTDYYDGPKYKSNYTNSYSYYPTYSSSSTYTPSTYSSDTTYYSSSYTPDTTYSYYGSSDRVYVRGHYRHYKSGKISYVRPHTRSYPGRGRRK